MRTDLLLSVVIPCYNEAGNIPLIVARFREVLSGMNNVEVILVNNGSTDNSEEVFDKVLAPLNDSRFRLVKVALNEGYGRGILLGLEAARGEVLGWTHADMQTDPQDVISAFQTYCSHADPKILVKGRRKERALIPALFTWAMQLIASYALRIPLEDIGAQPKIFSRQFYNKHLLTDAPKDFSLDLYAQYWAKKDGKIIEIPVFFKKRLHGEAKGGGALLSRLKISRNTFSYIFDLKKKFESV